MRIAIAVFLLILVVALSSSACQPNQAQPACFVTTSAPAAWLPGNAHLLLGSATGVQILDLQTLQVEKSIPSSRTLTPAIALSPAGDKFAWALEDHTIQLVRISDGKILTTLEGHTDLITRLKFSPDGKRLFSASHDTWVRLWGEDGSPVGAFQPAGADNLPSAVLGLAVSPDGKLLATIPADGPVRLWDANTFKPVRDLGGTGGLDTSDAAFSPDGRWIAAPLATGLFVWNTANGTALLGGNPGINSQAAAFSPDGQLLAYSEAGEKSSVVLAELNGSDKPRALEAGPTPAWRLLFSSDGSWLASASDSGLRIWHIADGKLQWIGKDKCP